MECLQWDDITINLWCCVTCATPLYGVLASSPNVLSLQWLLWIQCLYCWSVGGHHRQAEKNPENVTPPSLNSHFLSPLLLRLKTCEKIQQMRKYMRTISDSTFERFSGKYFTVWCREWAPMNQFLVWNVYAKAQTWGPLLSLRTKHFV